MNEEPGDELKRLRPLDPAAGAQAPEALRERVAAIAERELGASVSAGERSPRRRWLMPVAAAAIVAASFGAGTLLPSRGPGTFNPNAQDVSMVPLQTPEPGAIAPPVDLGTSGGPDDGTSATPIPGASSQDFAVTSSWLWPGGGRQHFSFPSFAGAAGQETVYAVDGASAYSEEEIVRIATALGVQGEPVNEQQGWRIGDPANAPSVSISAWDGTFSYYSRLGNPVANCVNATGSAVDQATYEQCLQQVPLPTEEQARAAMSAMLDALGFEEDDVLVTIDDSAKLERTLTVTASRIVEEKATPVAISAHFTHEGIVSAYGALGDIVSVGAYETVSADEAAQRLNTSAFAPRLTRAASTGQGMPVEAAPPTPPAVPQSGSEVPWGISEHTIVSARLGLSTVNSVNAVYIVPAYEFTDAEGNTWSVIALAENELDTTANVMNWWF